MKRPVHTRRDRAAAQEAVQRGCMRVLSRWLVRTKRTARSGCVKTRRRSRDRRRRIEAHGLRRVDVRRCHSPHASVARYRGGTRGRCAQRTAGREPLGPTSQVATRRERPSGERDRMWIGAVSPLLSGIAIRRSRSGRRSCDGQDHLAAPAPLQAAGERLARRREREDLDGRGSQLAGIGEPRDRRELDVVRLDGEVLASI